MTLVPRKPELLDTSEGPPSLLGNATRSVFGTEPQQTHAWPELAMLGAQHLLNQKSPMHLLVCVVNELEKLEEVLQGFLKIGVSGATVIRSEGMGKVLKDEAPVFSDLQALMSGARPQNTTIFSVVESKELLERALALVEEICGDLTRPSTGIAFTIRIEQVVGLSRRTSGAD